MAKIYLPYVVGTDDPIPYLFEEIVPRLSGEHSFTILTNKKSMDLGSHVTKLYAHEPNTLKRRLVWARSFIKNYDVIHTGGSVTKHRIASTLTRLRNGSRNHIHTFRIDVDPDGDYNTHGRKKLADSSDITTAVSKHTAKTVKNNFGIEPEVIYNGVDTEIFNPHNDGVNIDIGTKTDEPIFVFVGTLSNRKRPQDFVKVAENVPEADFLLIGDGDLEEEMNKRGDRISNLHVLGRVPKKDLPGIYANSDGLIFPSLREGCPNVVLEAMASGTPIIGYNATSMNEIVTNGCTGFLAPPKNIDSLIDKTYTLINDVDGETIGMNARSYVIDNHNFEDISKEYSEIYRKVGK